MPTCGDPMLDEEEIARRVRIQSTDQIIDAAVVVPCPAVTVRRYW